MKNLRAFDLEQYTAKAMLAEAERILRTMTVLQICQLSDERIASFPDWMPKKRSRARDRMSIAKGAIYEKLSRCERVEFND